MIPEGHFDFSGDDYDEAQTAEGTTSQPLDILQRYWGYDTFRPKQREIIDSVLSGKDTIGLLPTGGGKSITFQVPALILGGVTVVITPLISLMKDQVDRLRRMNIPSGCLHGGMSRRETDYVVERVCQSKIRIIYIAPERLARDNFIALLRRWDVRLFVVDEAHCISQWGYDFRPSYLTLDKVRDIVPEAPILALTASATPKVLDDIADKLSMKNPAIFSLSFSRNNISFRIVRTNEKLTHLVDIFRNSEGSAIVYVRSRKRTVELANALSIEGISAAFYHAGLDASTKNRTQEEWMCGYTRIMVATTAFGMGIDKADVRLVVHHDMPSTLEEYYQEAGRAGRDGKPAQAIMLASDADKAIFARRLTQSFPSKETIAFCYGELCRYLDIPMGGGYNQLYEYRPEEMSVRYRIDPNALLASLRILTRAGYIEYIEETATPTRVHITTRREQLYGLDVSPLADEILIYLLRHYPGLFADYVPITEERIAADCHTDVATVYQTLIDLRHQHILDFIPRNRTPYIYMPTARVENRYIDLPRNVYEDRRQAMEQHLNAMRQFVFGQIDCRVNHMLRYFGENPTEPCGKCDLCIASIPFRSTDVLEYIRELAAKSIGGQVPIANIRLHYLNHLDEAATELRRLIAEGSVTLSGTMISINGEN